MYGIMGKVKGEKKFKPLDYQNLRFVTNVIHQTLWDSKDEPQKIVDELNEDNKGNIEFKLIERA